MCTDSAFAIVSEAEVLLFLLFTIQTTDNRLQYYLPITHSHTDCTLHRTGAGEVFMVCFLSFPMHEPSFVYVCSVCVCRVCRVCTHTRIDECVCCMCVCVRAMSVSVQCVPGCMFFSFYTVVFAITIVEWKWWWCGGGGDDLTHCMRLTYVIISVERRSRTR